MAAGEPRAAHSSLVFPASSGAFWRATDWRKRIYKPVAESVGLAGARPCDLRHAFASLLIRRAGCRSSRSLHNPTVCIDTDAHVMAEERDGEHVSAEEQILPARTALFAAEQAEQLVLGGFDVP